MRRELVAGACVLSIALGACGWNPSRPFDRAAPAVDKAIGALDAGDAGAAAELLEDYLGTGRCKEGNVGTPDLLKKRPDGTFDLGLSLFRVGEAYGRRFGEEELDGGTTDEGRQMRAAQIECALRLVQAVAEDPSQPIELRARARYLEGNLDFLGGDYEQAVRAYDAAITLSPGQADAGDPVGRDAAWNRAIALRRIDDKKDAGSDGGNGDGGPPSNDGGRPEAGPPDAGKDGGGPGDSGRPDSGGGGNDGGNDSPPDAGNDAGNDASAPKPPPATDAGAPPPPPRASQDERILDQLENAPTVQEEAAKKNAQKHRVRGSADK